MDNKSPTSSSKNHANCLLEVAKNVVNGISGTCPLLPSSPPVISMDLMSSCSFKTIRNYFGNTESMDAMDAANTITGVKSQQKIL